MIKVNAGKVGMNLVGEYSDTNLYGKLDVVSYNGSSYSALKETIGHIPTDTEYWQLVAEKGEKGDLYELNDKDKKEIEDVVSEDLKGQINESFVIDEITCNEFIDDTTHEKYYIVHVPFADSEGNEIKLKRGFADDVLTDECGATENALDFAHRKNATFAVNASVFSIIQDSDIYNKIMGAIVHEGEYLYDNGYDTTAQTRTKEKTLGIKEGRVLEVYPNGTTGESLVEDGVKESINGFDDVMINGVINPSDNSYYQWNILAQNTETKDLYFMACDTTNGGMKLSSMCQILKDNYNCDFAYRLDQGGSTSLIYKGSMINQKKDNYNTEIRKVPDFIYFSKEITKDAENISAFLMNEVGKLKDHITDLENLIMNTGERGTLLKNIIVQYPETSSSGLSVTAKRGDDAQISLLMDADSQRTFALWDNVAGKTVARIYNDGRFVSDKLSVDTSGFIKTILGTMGYIPSNIPRKDSLDTTDYTTVFTVKADVTNSPFSASNKQALVLNFYQKDAFKIQVAIAMSSTQIPVKYRYGAYSGSTYNFSNWFDI